MTSHAPPGNFRSFLIIAAAIMGSSVVMLGESVVTLAFPSIGKRYRFRLPICSGSLTVTI